MKLKNGCSLPHQRSLDLANAFSVSTDATRGRWDFFAFGWGGGRGGEGEVEMEREVFGVAFVFLSLSTFLSLSLSFFAVLRKALVSFRP